LKAADLLRQLSAAAFRPVGALLRFDHAPQKSGILGRQMPELMLHVVDQATLLDDPVYGRGMAGGLGFPSRSPFRHVAGVQDLSCTPWKSLPCRRRLKRCPRYAAETLDPDVCVPSPRSAALKDTSQHMT
jgi:hypothetical protein